MNEEFKSTMRELKSMMREIKSAQERIKDYLDERARQDELFAKSYAKTNKNIDECYEYIVGEARKQCKDSDSICISDDVVYGWAVHYYDEDDINVGHKVASSTESKESTESTEMSAEDKKKVLDEARKKAYKTNKMASNANKNVYEAKKKSADAKKSKPARIQQLTLFDLNEL